MTSAWQRVTPDSPCPVCGRIDWCGLSEDGRLCICMRIEDGSVKPTANGGHLHRLTTEGDRGQRRSRTITRTISIVRGNLDMERLALECQRNVTQRWLDSLAAKLGLTPGSLHRLGIGWSEQCRAWAFPMRTADGGICGVQLRRPDGAKLSVRGSRQGLFVPAAIAAATTPAAATPATTHRQLLIAEGATDAAALLDLGYTWAVGRPGCSAAVTLLADYCRLHRPAEVVVVSDNDEHGAGQRGAADLAAALLCYCPIVRVVTPPTKDVRQWLLAGATRADVEALIEAAPARRLRKGGGA